MIKDNLLGKVFTYWTVFEEAAPDKFGHIRWGCICKCGNKKIVSGTHLKTGKSQSCGCFKLEKITKFSPQEASAREVWRQNYKELLFEEFLTLSQQNCHYCNRPPNNKLNTWSNKQNQRSDLNLLSNHIKDGDFIYSGLDRIDSSKTHTIDNVVPCCKWCNYAKRERSYDDFVSWIRTVHAHIIKEK